MTAMSTTKRHSSTASAGGDIHMGMAQGFRTSPLMGNLIWICCVGTWACGIGGRDGAGWERCLVGDMGRKITEGY